MSIAFISQSIHSYYPGLTTVTQYSMACQNPPLHRLPLLSTLQLVQSKTLALEITSPTPFSNYTGCPFKLGYPLSSFDVQINLKSCSSLLIIFVTPCAALESRRGLRSASKRNFVIKRSNLQFGNRMFEVAGPAEWNSLPELIRRSSSINTFKSKLISSRSTMIRNYTVTRPLSKTLFY